MSTNFIVGLVVGAVVVIGGGYYLMTNSGGSASDSKAAQEQEQNVAESTEATLAQAGKFNGSLSELAARGGSWKCTVDASTAQSVSSGVTYASGGKVRSDFSTKVQGYGNVESHVIADGQDVYTWSSVMPQGIKTKMAQQTDGGTATSGQGVNTNQPYSYDCQPWTADASVFVTPSSVVFKTIGN
ncbi:MAG: hypothetical protein Q7S08_04190 [bacterium]|nr:hypothetical protein [bacterium]